jgi:hypothetical protein
MTDRTQTAKVFFTALESIRGRFSIIARRTLFVAMIYPVYTVIANVLTKGLSSFNDPVKCTIPFYEAAIAWVLFLIAMGGVMVILEIVSQSRAKNA